MKTLYLVLTIWNYGGPGNNVLIPVGTIGECTQRGHDAVESFYRKFYKSGDHFKHGYGLTTRKAEFDCIWI